MFAAPYDVPIPKAEGGHGGGDPIMLQHLFLPNPPADPFGRAAGFQEGLDSIMIGISANRSIQTGQPVNCDNLFNAAAAKHEAVDKFGRPSPVSAK